MINEHSSRVSEKASRRFPAPGMALSLRIRAGGGKKSMWKFYAGTADRGEDEESGKWNAWEREIDLDLFGFFAQWLRFASSLIYESRNWVNRQKV